MTSRKQCISISLENDLITKIYLPRFRRVYQIYFPFVFRISIVHFRRRLYLFQNAKAFCILSLCGFPVIMAAGYARCAAGICELSDFDVSLSLSNILAVRLTFPVETNLLRLRPLNILVSVLSLVTAKKKKIVKFQ